MIPPLVVHCVNEIEQKGLHEVSLTTNFIEKTICSIYAVQHCGLCDFHTRLACTVYLELTEW